MRTLIFEPFYTKIDEHILGKASKSQNGWLHQFHGAFVLRAVPVCEKIMNFKQTLWTKETKKKKSKLTIENSDIKNALNK